MFHDESFFGVIKTADLNALAVKLLAEEDSEDMLRLSVIGFETTDQQNYIPFKSWCHHILHTRSSRMLRMMTYWT